MYNEHNEELVNNSTYLETCLKLHDGLLNVLAHYGDNGLSPKAKSTFKAVLRDLEIKITKTQKTINKLKFPNDANT